MSTNLEGMNLRRRIAAVVAALEKMEAAIELENSQPAEHEARQAAETMKRWCTGRDCATCFLYQGTRPYGCIPSGWHIPAAHSMLALAGVIKAHCAAQGTVCHGCVFDTEHAPFCLLRPKDAPTPGEWDVPVNHYVKYDPLTAAREIRERCSKTDCSNCQMYDKHKGCVVAPKTTGLMPQDWELPE